MLTRIGSIIPFFTSIFLNKNKSYLRVSRKVAFLALINANDAKRFAAAIKSSTFFKSAGSDEDIKRVNTVSSLIHIPQQLEMKGVEVLEKLLSFLCVRYFFISHNCNHSQKMEKDPRHRPWMSTCSQNIAVK